MLDYQRRNLSASQTELRSTLQSIDRELYVPDHHSKHYSDDIADLFKSAVKSYAVFPLRDLRGLIGLTSLQTQSSNDFPIFGYAIMASKNEEVKRPTRKTAGLLKMVLERLGTSIINVINLEHQNARLSSLRKFNEVSLNN